MHMRDGIVCVCVCMCLFVCISMCVRQVLLMLSRCVRAQCQSPACPGGGPVPLGVPRRGLQLRQQRALQGGLGSRRRQPRQHPRVAAMRVSPDHAIA